MNGAKNLPMRRTQNKIIILLLFLAKSSLVDRLSNLLRHAVENSFWLLLLLLLNVKLDNRVIGWMGDDVAVVVVILLTLRQRR